MSSWHGDQVYGLSYFFTAELTISLVISKAVFDSNNDPAMTVRCHPWNTGRLACWPGQGVYEATYHRFVNTTPNPRATKNNKGELVALFELEPSPSLLAVVVAAALLEADVGVEDIPTEIRYEKDLTRNVGARIIVGVSVAQSSILHALSCVYRATLYVSLGKTPAD